jgi:Ca-activated chloride channel family protein
VVSVLNENLLEELTRAGQGSYQQADFRDDDTEEILEAAAVIRLPPEAGAERTRIWNERYYLPVLALAALLVPNFRGRSPRRRKT